MAEGEERYIPTLLDLLLAFGKMSVVSVGGGTIAWARQIIVREKGWMTDDELLQARALSQILPGPNMLNFATYVGAHFRGAPGALVCLFGLTAIPVIIVMTLGILYFKYGTTVPAKGGGFPPFSSGALLAGLASAAAGTSFGTALGSGGKHFKEPIFVVLTIFVFVSVSFLKWPMIPVALGTAATSMALYWPRKKKEAS